VSNSKGYSSKNIGTQFSQSYVRFRFADVINIDFFDDLLTVLENLLKSGDLKQRQILQCTAVVLSILDGQGAALTLDPTAFHKKLYATLLYLHCGELNFFV